MVPSADGSSRRRVERAGGSDRPERADHTVSGRDGPRRRRDWTGSAVRHSPAHRRCHDQPQAHGGQDRAALPQAAPIHVLDASKRRRGRGQPARAHELRPEALRGATISPRSNARHRKQFRGGNHASSCSCSYDAAVTRRGAARSSGTGNDVLPQTRLHGPTASSTVFRSDETSCPTSIGPPSSTFGSCVGSFRRILDRRPARARRPGSSTTMPVASSTASVEQRVPLTANGVYGFHRSGPRGRRHRALLPTTRACNRAGHASTPCVSSNAAADRRPVPSVAGRLRRAGFRPAVWPITCRPVRRDRRTRRLDDLSCERSRAARMTTTTRSWSRRWPTASPRPFAEHAASSACGREWGYGTRRADLSTAGPDSRALPRDPAGPRAILPVPDHTEKRTIWQRAGRRA